MIPATVPCYARFNCKVHRDDEKTYWQYRRVLAWDDDGHALVLPNKGAGLVPADSYRNFDGLSDSETHPPLVAIAPGGGWRVEYTADDGKSWSEPLAGWGLREGGEVVPLETDCDGIVSDFEHRGGKWRIYHPDQDDSA